MRRAAPATAVLALFVVGCGGGSGGATSGSSTASTVRTGKTTAPERRPAAPAVLGIASRYVDPRVADGRLPPVHVGRADVLGRIGIAYLVGGSDIAGGAAGTPVKGLWGVLVLAKQGGAWRARPPVVRLQGHS
jgi:hypothetical protein